MIATTGLILKGKRWLIHDKRSEPNEVVLGHIIHWHGEREIAAACGERYHFIGWASKGSFARFVSAYGSRPQIANTCIRQRIAIDRLCPVCRQEFEWLVAQGLVRQEHHSEFHPATTAKNDGAA